MASVYDRDGIFRDPTDRNKGWELVFERRRQAKEAAAAQAARIAFLEEASAGSKEGLLTREQKAELDELIGRDQKED